MEPKEDGEDGAKDKYQPDTVVGRQLLVRSDLAGGAEVRGCDCESVPTLHQSLRLLEGPTVEALRSRLKWDISPPAKAAKEEPRGEP